MITYYMIYESREFIYAPTDTVWHRSICTTSGQQLVCLNEALRVQANKNESTHEKRIKTSLVNEMEM